MFSLWLCSWRFLYEARRGEARICLQCYAVAVAAIRVVQVGMDDVAIGMCGFRLYFLFLVPFFIIITECSLYSGTLGGSGVWIGGFYKAHVFTCIEMDMWLSNMLM